MGIDLAHRLLQLALTVNAGGVAAALQTVPSVCIRPLPLDSSTQTDGTRGNSFAGVTLECFPRGKFARGEIITDLICLTLLKYRRPHKSLPIIGSPPEKSSPRRQFTGKNPTSPGGRRAGQIFVGKLSAGGDFSGRRSYNETPARRGESVEQSADFALGRTRRRQARHGLAAAAALAPDGNISTARANGVHRTIKQRSQDLRLNGMAEYVSFPVQFYRESSEQS